MHLGKVVQIANRLGCPKGESKVNQTRTLLFPKALFLWNANKLPLSPAKLSQRVRSHWSTRVPSSWIWHLSLWLCSPDATGPKHEPPTKLLTWWIPVSIYHENSWTFVTNMWHVHAFTNFSSQVTVIAHLEAPKPASVRLSGAEKAEPLWFRDWQWTTLGTQFWEFLRYKVKDSFLSRLN